MADFTYQTTGEGWLYLAAVIDAFSGYAVGWNTSDRPTTDLVLGALDVALWRRQIEPERLIHHSDQGAQYTAIAFGQALRRAGIIASMGSVGDAYDNALMESFFSTIKRELLSRRRWATRHEAEMAIFTWIEGWYNTRRIQARLGWRSPAQYEAHFYSNKINDHT